MPPRVTFTLFIGACFKVKQVSDWMRLLSAYKPSWGGDGRFTTFCTWGIYSLITNLCAGLSRRKGKGRTVEGKVCFLLELCSAASPPDPCNQTFAFFKCWNWSERLKKGPDSLSWGMKPFEQTWNRQSSAEKGAAEDPCPTCIPATPLCWLHQGPVPGNKDQHNASMPLHLMPPLPLLYPE